MSDITDTSLFKVQYINTPNIKLFITENEACFDLRQSNAETRRGALDRVKWERPWDGIAANSWQSYSELGLVYNARKSTLDVHKHNNDNTNNEFS